MAECYANSIIRRKRNLFRQIGKFFVTQPDVQIILAVQNPLARVA